MLVGGSHYRTVWLDGSTVKMIDQTLLPHQFKIIDLPTHLGTAKAIFDMKVRGAGAIGATAGYAMAQVVLQAQKNNFTQYLQKGKADIEKTRPTAQNLFYATNRVYDAVKNLPLKQARQKAVDTANAIADEDSESCRKIGEHGSKLINDKFNISTHCNAGWLAFVDHGSALSPIYRAASQGKDVFVYVDETRPRAQGASLTSWELMNEGIKHVIIVDNATGFLMQKGRIDIVIVGADRIAANGDVANKIGTYEKAVCAKENSIPFYVAAPTTTIDFNTPTGSSIPIEERNPDEVLYMWGQADSKKFERVRIAPKKATALNIAFDVTPARYITGIITEKGVLKPGNLAKLMAK